MTASGGADISCAVGVRISVAKKPDRTIRRIYACNGKVARFTIAKKRYVIRGTKSMQVSRIVVEGPNAIVTYMLTRARKR